MVSKNKGVKMKTKEISYAIEAECDYMPCRCDCCEDGQHMAVVHIADSLTTEYQCDECGQYIDISDKVIPQEELKI